MAKKFPDPLRLERDGTSQAGRVQAALDPGYVAVDERSFTDLLAFAREYAGMLRYYDERDQAAGDWSAFLPPDTEVKLDEVAAFVDSPARLSKDKALRLGRPHLALFLTFVKLLRHPREQLDALTRRHLEFYYEEVLRMSRKAALPDRVHVLVRPAVGVDRVLVPAGTLLRAGKDSAGQERVYRTDRELLASRARIARLSSVRVDKRNIGIREARELHRGSAQEAFVRMLDIGLGYPQPGDPLPQYEGGHDVDFDLLLELKRQADFASVHLFMEFYDLRSMMELKRRRDQADDEWAEINRFLEKAGQTRLGDHTWRLKPSDPRHFHANLVKAIGGEPDFGELPLVDSVDDLYRQPRRDDVLAFIRDALHFSNHGDFVSMMQIKVRIDNEWREINRILEQAGKNKRGNSSYELRLEDPADFPANLRAALDLPGAPLDFSSLPGIVNIDRYYDAILNIESYFHMWAEDFAYMMNVATKSEPTAGEWDKVYRVVADAYKERIYAERRERLKAAREADGFDAMLRVALGEEAGESDESPLTRLRTFVKNDQDYTFLQQIQQAPDAGEVSQEDWGRVYRIVEIAQRVREQSPEPVAQIEEWRNLYAFEDATAMAVTPDVESKQSYHRWKTLGQRPSRNSQGSPPAESLGWAISSPLLALRQGTRTVTLTLGFRAQEFDAGKVNALLAQQPFTVEASTEKGWSAPAEISMAQGDYKSLSGLSGQVPELRALQFTLSFGADADPITAPAADAGIVCSWPVLRLMLRQIWDDERKQYIIHYQPLKDLALMAVHVKVGVDGFAPSHIQNDQAILDSNKPFELFGSSPAAGSRFYVSDTELIVKRLDSLTFHVEWMGVPSNLAAHYKNYGGVNGTFKADVILIDHHLEFPLKEGAVLFAAPDAARPHDIGATNIPDAIRQVSQTYRYQPILTLPAQDDLLAWPRYVQWELGAPDFQHQTYPAVASKKAVAMAAAIANRSVNKDLPEIKADDYQVSPPYTPKIKSLRLGYTASVEVSVQDLRVRPGADRLFHVHPFGLGAVQDEARAGENVRFLPRYDNEGELYIGIDKASPPQNLSILFQMAEGSANPDLEPMPIEWSYLSGDRWISLHGGNILSDTTRGLINSGIIELALEPAAPSTRLPGELHWIRAAIPYHADSVCDTVAIHTQAVSAMFVDRNNAADHYQQPLAERSITGLARRMPGVAGIEQPYTSQGGKMAERAGDFYTRVSERLRHKQRALTVWDYERLVLERFPQIYKAKCLPAGVAGLSDGPGKVVVIVIPDIRDQSLANPFEPKAPANLIADITSYLADKCPAHAAVEVRNAHYVPVRVRVGVRFRPGRDEGFYKNLLNEEINRFLSPWAYEKSQDITIGARIYANSIVNFIDERDYVDYVATIKLFSSEDGRTFKMAPLTGSSGYFVTTERPDGVLVAAQKHDIDIITEIGYKEELFTGINYMKIELDFVVG
jgi:hypothetical protein